MSENIGKHHEGGSPEAKKHDPYGSYPGGIISPPDEIRRGTLNGVGVLAVRVGERWANVHPLRPGVSYGIRWWMGQHEVDELGWGPETNSKSY